MLSAACDELNCKAKVLDTPPADAARVTDWGEVNGETVAQNPAEVALAGTVTAAGTETVPLLLDRLTTSPPLGAAPFRVTVQESAPDAVIVALLHEIALNATAVVPVPLRLTTALGLFEALLEIVTTPVNELA